MRYARVQIQGGTTQTATVALGIVSATANQSVDTVKFFTPGDLIPISISSGTGTPATVTISW